MGKRVHEILERLYHHVARYGRPPSLAQVLDRFRQDWERALARQGDDRAQRERARATTGSAARAASRTTTASHYPFTTARRSRSSSGCSLQLDPDGRYSCGRHRRPDRAPRRRRASRSTTTRPARYLPPQRALDRDRQLALYQIGLEQTYPDAQEVELVWHYLVFNRTLRSRRSARGARGAAPRRRCALIDAIEAEPEYRAQPGPLCRWCDYAELCPDAPEEARAAARRRPALAARLVRRAGARVRPAAQSLLGE